MAGILDLMGYIQDQSEKGRQAGLSRLVGKAYGAAPDQQQQILSTVAQRGAPDLAMSADKAFGEQQDNVHLQMAKRAAEVVALYQSNPQMAQQVYQNGLLPIARRAGVPNAPMQLDASLIPGLEKLASAANATGVPAELQTFNTLTQGMSPEDIANARRVKLGLDSRAPVVQPGQYDSSRGAFVSNPFYGGTRQQAPAQQMPQRMTDEQIAATANQMTQQGVPGDQVDQWVRQQQSMTQYEPAPAPAAAPAASQAVPVAGLPEKPKEAPAGYRFVGDHLEAIPGGPADPKVQAQGNDNGRNYVIATGPDGTVYRVNKITGQGEAVQGVQGGGASLGGLNFKKDSLAVQKGTGANQIERGLQRLEAAVNKLSGNRFFDGGPLDQYALAPTKLGQEMEQATGSIMPALTALTRVPGVGSQSDWEGRLNMMQLPSVRYSPEVNKRAIAGLRQFVNDLRQAYANVGIPFPMDANSGQTAAPAQPAQSADDARRKALLDKY